MENNKQSNTPDFNKLEEGILKFWEENNIFQKSLEQTKNNEPYVFYDGPPFATGLPHYGHILASTIKDAIPRYQTMKGKFVRRVWGWDCHGLPIENIVEQILKISGKKQIEELGVEKFNQTCRENVLRFVDEWGKMVKRMGRWVEFQNSYKTMDTSYMESVWWGIKQVWNKGLIYQDRKVLLYCSRCETPISNFEVAMDNSYKDVSEDSVFVKFKVLPRQRIVNDLTNEKTYALAWTTTPWTLPGNTSLNIGSDIKYVMVEQSNERYILAKERLAILQGEYEIISEFSARDLENLQYEPLYNFFALAKEKLSIPEEQVNRLHRFYLADFVTTTDGTGIVHNAAMYGEEDYELAKTKNLPRVDMLDSKGHYLEVSPEHLRGVFFKKADKIVIEDLTKNSLLYKVEHYTHSYPHCYRCSTPLFYNALPAWFINIQKVKGDLVLKNEEVSWYPGHLKKGRFGKSLEQAPDWNISRNRFWATPLPFWKCGAVDCREKVCVGSVKELRDRSLNFGEVYPAAELRIKNYELGSENHNSQFILQDSDLDLHKPYIDQVKLKCEKCEGEMQRVSEVVDCWVESGSMPFAELHYPFENKELFEKRFPADFVAEYIGQTRAWFYVMHAVSGMIFEKAPFRNVVTTGNILAEDGSKMSKSKNNYPDPWVLIEKFGIDAIRFYLLTSPVMNADDFNFSEKGVQEVSRKVSLLLYNVWSFYRMYEKQVISGQYTELKLENVLDKWIISRLSKARSVITKQMDEYNTVKAGKEIVDFIADLSTWYLRRSRDRIKLGDETSKSTLNTLGFVLTETAKLTAPFMPFLADFIFKDITGKESVHLEIWSNVESYDEKLLEEMEVVRKISEFGQSLRKEKGVKVRQPLLELVYSGVELNEQMHTVVLEELNVKTVSGKWKVESRQNVEEWAIRDEQGLKVGLNLTITDELKKEGFARELERQIQDLRKKSGLKPGDLVNLYYNTQDSEMENVLLSIVDRKKTFVNQISKSLEVEVDYEVQGEVEGKPVWLGVLKI